ncbi:hypothetical protein ElP_02060 [Tautonia plasticadhaerens]|uniref:Ice-binding protein C-terminal domain-containing protein n=2 Tax=Tautonia plasticadhaerens TaxID=2527974 RepID=A0A518GUW0_9BACT|nr:hypothetical protein ElP_02060 [Tautonia plasticadhaerens]
MALAAAALLATSIGHAVPSTASEIPARYHFTGLGSLEGVRLNNLGQVLGSSPVNKHTSIWGSFAALYSGYGPDAGSVRAVLGPRSAHSRGIDFNDRGEVLAWESDGSRTGNWSGRPVLWDGSAARPVYDPDDGVLFIPNRLNNQGMVTGYASELGAYGPATWVDGRLERLAEPFQGGESYAITANDRGQVLGLAWPEYDRSLPTPEPHPVIWEGGQPRLLESWLGGYNGFADMNDAGQIVGSRYDPDRGYQGFLYQDGETIDLGLPEWVHSNPVAINGEGDVIGSAQGPDGNTVWYLASEGSVIPLEDLLPPELGWTVVELLDLNDSGQILGVGHAGWGPQTSFILTPPGMDAPAAVSTVDQVVPEPTTLAMLGLIGATGLARRAVRRRWGR